MKLPSFFPRKNNTGESKKFERPSILNSNTECLLCSPPRADKTAKLLIVTGQWNFYYCYRCRSWFQAHYSSRELVLRVEDKKLASALTWFWKSENEMIEEHRRALEWLYSLFAGDRAETQSTAT